MSVFVKINAKDQTGPGFRSARNNVNRLSKDVKKAARTMKVLGVAALAIGVKAVSEFASFDNKVREITTLLGDVTENEVKNLGNEIKETAITYGQSLDSMAKARYDIISAGFNDAARSATVLQQAAKLAVAGVSQVSTTADILTTVLNSYSMQAKQATTVSDILFTTVRLGKTTINELASQFGIVASIAPTVGVKLKEVAAMYATLTAAGQRTEISTTAIQAAMNALLNPSEALKQKLKDIGFETGVSAVKQLGFVETLKRVTAGTNAADKAAMFPNVRAMKAVFPLIGAQAKKFADNLAQMGDVSGTTDVAVGKMAKGIQFKINQIKTKISATLTDIGGKIVLLGGKFLDLDDNLKNLIVSIAGIGLAIKLLGPSITALIGASYLIYKAWDKNIGGVKSIIKLWYLDFQKDITDVWRWLISSAQAVSHAVVNVFKLIFTSTIKNVGELWSNIGKEWQADQLEYNKKSWESSRDYWREQAKIYEKGAASIGSVSDFLPDVFGSLPTIPAPKIGQPEPVTPPQDDPTVAAAQAAANQKIAIAKAAAQTQKEILDDLGAYDIETTHEVSINTAKSWQNRLESVNDVINQITDVAEQYQQYQNVLIENRAKKEKKSAQQYYEAERSRILQTMTVEGVLTERGHRALERAEQQYQNRLSSIQNQAAEQEKRVAKRMRVVKIFQAISNTALGVTKALAQGGFLGIATGALVAASGAIQIATIRASAYATGTPFATQKNMFAPQGNDTIPALLSEGEAVIPAPVVRENAPLIHQLVGGQVQNHNVETAPVSLNMNITAIDAAGVEQFVRSESFRAIFIELVNDHKIDLRTNAAFETPVFGVD